LGVSSPFFSFVFTFPAIPVFLLLSVPSQFLPLLWGFSSCCFFLSVSLSFIFYCVSCGISSIFFCSPTAST
jgi:hypothetical protein